LVSELHDVRDFIAAHLPFAGLPGAALDALPRHVSVRYLRRGSAFPPADGATPAFYLVRKGAIELRDESGALLDKLGEGDGFDSAVPEGGESAVAGRAVEDSLVYVIPEQAVAQLRRDHPAFRERFDRSIAQRLRRAQESLAEAAAVGGNLLRLEVADLLSRSPVTATPALPIREAAEQMTRERVSALLVVEDGRLVGILTDRDLRSRCVAQDLPGATPLSKAMTPDPYVVSPRASAFEAMMMMSRLRVHHLPVVDEEGVHGLVSTIDLLKAQATNPLYLADRVGRCVSAEQLHAVVAETRELHRQLVASSATARQLGQAVTSVCDAVTRRLVDLAMERHGPPPVPFAWIATGSQGRGELTLRSDQDNCMLLDDDYDVERHGAYFESVARFVNEGLDACGYVSCPGEVMASNPRWRQPLAAWLRYFQAWLKQTTHNTATLAVNFLDMRTVWGEDRLRQRLMGTVLPACAGEKVFLAYLAGHALGNQPPLGFFRNFVLSHAGDHEGTVDLKARGILPIVDLARIYALATGVEAVGTLQRLDDAAETGGVTRDGAESLKAAFELVWQIRAHHHVEQALRGEALDGHVAPAALGAVERRHLKDAFAAIATMQQAVRSAYGDRLPL